jgi:hypothetical protein
MLNVLVLRNGAIPDSMTAMELLAKVTVVFQMSDLQSTVGLSPSELSKKYQKRLQTFPQNAWMQFEFSCLRDIIEDIVRAKSDSFDTGISI